MSIEGQGHFLTLAQCHVHTKVQTGFSQKVLCRSELNFYAPNFEKVDGAYCFWSVRGWVRAWVTLFVPTVTFKPLKLES